MLQFPSLRHRLDIWVALQLDPIGQFRNEHSRHDRHRPAARFRRPRKLLEHRRRPFAKLGIVVRHQHINVLRNRPGRLFRWFAAISLAFYDKHRHFRCVNDRSTHTPQHELLNQPTSATKAHNKQVGVLGIHRLEQPRTRRAGNFALRRACCQAAGSRSAAAFKIVLLKTERARCSIAGSSRSSPSANSRVAYSKISSSRSAESNRPTNSAAANEFDEPSIPTITFTASSPHLPSHRNDFPNSSICLPPSALPLPPSSPASA